MSDTSNPPLKATQSDKDPRTECDFIGSHLMNGSICDRCGWKQSDKELEQILNKVKSNDRMILYTHVIGRDNKDWCQRDDLWAISTEELNKLEHLIAEETNTARIDELEKADYLINSNLGSRQAYKTRIKELRAQNRSNDG